MSPIAYYRVRADAAFWSSEWQQQSLDRLLAVAHASELTRFLERYIEAGTRLLEGGCGLGQYVRYFRERDVEVVGVDFSEGALASHRNRFPDSDVRLATLEHLPFEDGSFDVYLSVGVIEHYPDFGAAILAEARRVLASNGRLLLSTPYSNLSRRAFRGVISRRQRSIKRFGGDFYQFAFTASELDRILVDAGFRLQARGYYDPGRGLRDVLALMGRHESESRAAARAAAATRAHSSLKRRLAYSAPVLRTFAHMQVVSARKVSDGETAR